VKGRHFWSDDDQSRVQRSRLLERTSVPSFQVGVTLLLRDANLKRFDTPVEFRALEEDRALVLIRGHFVSSRWSHCADRTAWIKTPITGNAHKTENRVRLGLQGSLDPKKTLRKIRSAMCTDTLAISQQID
jgi:hypothetical protein